MPNWDGVDSLRLQAIEGTLDAKLGALIYSADMTGSLMANPRLTPKLWLRRVLDQAAQGGVTYLYVTDRPSTAPWSALPTYWSELVSLLASAPSPSPSDYEVGSGF